MLTNPRKVPLLLLVVLVTSLGSLAGASLLTSDEGRYSRLTVSVSGALPRHLCHRAVRHLAVSTPYLATRRTSHEGAQLALIATVAGTIYDLLWIKSVCSREIAWTGPGQVSGQAGRDPGRAPGDESGQMSQKKYLFIFRNEI